MISLTKHFTAVSNLSVQWVACLPVTVQVEFVAIFRPRDVDRTITINVTVQDN